MLGILQVLIMTHSSSSSSYVNLVEWIIEKRITAAVMSPSCDATASTTDGPIVSSKRNCKFSRMSFRSSAAKRLPIDPLGSATRSHGPETAMMTVGGSSTSSAGSPSSVVAIATVALPLRRGFLGGGGFFLSGFVGDDPPPLFSLPSPPHVLTSHQLPPSEVEPTAPFAVGLGELAAEATSASCLAAMTPPSIIFQRGSTASASSLPMVVPAAPCTSSTVCVAAFSPVVWPLLHGVARACRLLTRRWITVAASDAACLSGGAIAATGIG
mmetsp:Transcript_110010/g.320220  ORF Transcript_110010/g.320220 Transcript_110010/m.320220 type:complete len:269 (-) Transcript_110010:340-1146(-)